MASELRAVATICREHGAAALAADVKNDAVARAVTDTLYALGARFDTRADQWANG